MPSYRQSDSTPNPAPSTNAKKIPYIPTQRNRDGMTSAEKEGVRLWNLMVTTLRENGLMEDKK